MLEAEVREYIQSSELEEASTMQEPELIGFEGVATTNSI